MPRNYSVRPMATRQQTRELTDTCYLQKGLLSFLMPGVQHVSPMCKPTVHSCAMPFELELMAQLEVICPRPPCPVRLLLALPAHFRLYRHLVELHC